MSLEEPWVMLWSDMLSSRTLPLLKSPTLIAEGYGLAAPELGIWITVVLLKVLVTLLNLVWASATLPEPTNSAAPLVKSSATAIVNNVSAVLLSILLP